MIFSKTAFNAEIHSNYQYLKVGGFTAVSDLWTIGVFRIQSEKQFFPMATTVFGFAKSYKIEHSVMLGRNTKMILNEYFENNLIPVFPRLYFLAIQLALPQTPF